MKVPNFRILCWRRVCRKVFLKAGRDAGWGRGLLDDIVLFVLFVFSLL